MHKQHKHLISVLTTLSLLIGVAISVAPYPYQSAQAVLYTPLNNKRPKDFAIIRKDSVWHVYAIYCTIGNGNCETTYPGLMHLTSTDLTNWTEVGYVIPPGAPGSWDDGQTWAPSVVEKDGVYYMFYAAIHRNGSNVDEQKIGVATSTDLYTWTKSPSNPIVNCDNFSWAYWDASNSIGVDCRDPNVFWDETEHQWVMLMSARSMDDGLTPPWIDKPTVIGIATSDDLMTWREYGYIPNTRDYISESSHVVKHGSTYYLFMTDNGDGGQGLSYLSSSNLYTGWSAQANVPTVGSNEYASEYIQDDGREYFVRIGNNNLTFDFDELVWTGSPFTVQEISYASVGDVIYQDADADGVYDGGETGIDNVTVRLYHDNGDGVFDVSTDDVYDTKVTGDDPNTGGTQHGFYKFTTVLPGNYWLSIDPTNYNAGNALSGKVETTANSVTALTLTNSQSNLTQDIGFANADTTYRLTSPSDFSVGSGLTLSSGRVAPTASSSGASPAWWHNDWRFRTPLTVTANNESLDTTKTITLSIDLPSLVTAQKVQADFDDFRIVYWNGSTNVEVPVDIIDATTQRFKLQASITSGNANGNYYLYYGNPAATKLPVDFARVYDYYASFNAPDATTYGSWTESHSDTNWAISNNRWRYNATTAADRYSSDTSKTINLSEDYSAEVSLTINTGQIGGVSLIRTDSIAEDKYWTNVDAVNDLTQFYSHVYGHLGSDSAITINTGTEYRYRVWFNYLNNTLRFLHDYVDNVSAHTHLQSSVNDIWDSSTYPSNLTSAHFGLNTYNGNVSFNDYKGWRMHDASTSTSTEQILNPAVTSSIQPVSGQGVAFTKLESFRASSLDQGGSVRFVISNDNGSTWQYWNGSAWATSNSTAAQANTPAQISAQAASFPTGSGQFLWKSLLTATSNTYPVLLHVAATTNSRPTVPSLIAPTPGSNLSVFQPTFSLTSTDSDTDSLQYEIQIDTVHTFDSPDVQTIVQSSSQSGWSGQDASSGTRYASGTQASHVPVTALGNHTYYWRARSIDPSGSNVASAYSSASSFTTPGVLMITDIETDEVSPTAFTITWTTSNAGTSQLKYGSTTSYGTTIHELSPVSHHEILVTNVTTGSTYHYQITTTDAYGQTTASADQVITVGGALRLTDVRVSATATTATITWTSSAAATSRVDFGATSGYGQSVSHSNMTTSHSLTLTGLTPGATYAYSVSSVDALATTAASPNSSFTTATTNALAGITDVRVTGRTSTSVTLAWTTPEPTTSRIIYGKTTAYGAEVESTVSATSHTYTLGGLSPATTYHYVVVGRGSGTTTSADTTFTTLSKPRGRAVPPTILSVTRLRTAPQTIRVIGLARGGQSVVVFIDGHLRRRLRTTGQSTQTRVFMTQIRSKLLTRGPHTITAQSTDAVGRTSQIRQRVNVTF